MYNVLKLKDYKMPKCYQLIGIPGSGKSTWVNNQDWTMTCAYVSTDKWVEIYAKEVGRTYSEVFVDFMPTAVDLMAKEVVVTREPGGTPTAEKIRKLNLQTSVLKL